MTDMVADTDTDWIGRPSTFELNSPVSVTVHDRLSAIDRATRNVGWGLESTIIERSLGIWCVVRQLLGDLILSRRRQLG